MRWARVGKGSKVGGREDVVDGGSGGGLGGGVVRLLADEIDGFFARFGRCLLFKMMILERFTSETASLLSSMLSILMSLGESADLLITSSGESSIISILISLSSLGNLDNASCRYRSITRVDKRFAK